MLNKIDYLFEIVKLICIIKIVYFCISHRLACPVTKIKQLFSLFFLEINFMEYNGKFKYILYRKKLLFKTKISSQVTKVQICKHIFLCKEFSILCCLWKNSLLFTSYLAIFLIQGWTNSFYFRHCHKPLQKVIA